MPKTVGREDYKQKRVEYQRSIVPQNHMKETVHFPFALSFDFFAKMCTQSHLKIINTRLCWFPF